MTEIRDRLNEIIKNCEEALSEIDSEKNNSEESSSIDFAKLKNVAAKFNYNNPEVNNIDDGIKYSYIKLLIHLFNKLEGKQLETVLLHIEKIILAMQIKIELKDELISSYGYDEKKLMKLIEDVSKMPISPSQMFVMDVLIIIFSADVREDIIYKSVAAIISNLGLKKKEIKELFALAQCISCSDYEKYKKITSQDYDINITGLLPYFEDKFSGVLSNNKKLIWLNGNSCEKDLYLLCEKQSEESWGEKYQWYTMNTETLIIENVALNITDSLNFSIDNIVFRNCNITLNSEHKYNYFEKGKKILFENCKVNIKTSCHLKFDNCDSIELKNSEFYGTGEYRCFISYKCKQIRIDNCTFENFANVEKGDSSYQYSAIQGCFEINESNGVTITKCKFIKCCTKHYEKGKANGAVGAFFDTSKITIRNNSFRDCKNYSWRYGSHWDEINYMFVFSKDILPDMEDNEFTNCAEPYERRHSLW